MAEGESGTLSYEQAREQLAGVVKRLEAGGLTLEESIELWERGEELAAICTQWLDGARARLAAAMARQRDEASEQEGRLNGQPGTPVNGQPETPF